MNVQEILEKAPALIASAAMDVTEERRLVDECKEALSVAEANATIAYRHKVKNQKVLQAYIDLDADVKAAKKALRDATVRYEAAKTYHEGLYNQFVSARKLGGMDDKELHTIRGATISDPRKLPPPASEER